MNLSQIYCDISNIMILYINYFQGCETHDIHETREITPLKVYFIIKRHFMIIKNYFLLKILFKIIKNAYSSWSLNK